jgi:hypothetical protein
VPTTFLSGGTWTRPHGVAWFELTATGYVHTRGGVDNLGGGYTETYSAGTTGVPCRVDPVGGRSAEFADQIDERSTHLIAVPPHTPITEADRFVVTGAGTFEITVVRTRTGEELRLLEGVKF